MSSDRYTVAVALSWSECLYWAIEWLVLIADMGWYKPCRWSSLWCLLHKCPVTQFAGSLTQLYINYKTKKPLNGHIAGARHIRKVKVSVWCLPSWLSTVGIAGLSRLLLHASGTPCKRRRRQLSRWRHSVSILRHGSSNYRIQSSSSDLLFTDCLTASLL